MGHQPFEDWILDKSNYTNQQETLLTEHLEECDQCSSLNTSWNAVNRELRESTMVSPLPGFMARWKITLANKKAIEHQMQAIKTFISISCAILITVGALFAWLVLTNSVSDVIVGGVNLFTGFVQAYINLRAAFANFVKSAPPITPYLFWTIIAGWALVLTSMWGLTIWRISRQGVVSND